MIEPNNVLCLEDDLLDAELIENAVRAVLPAVRWRHARTRRDFDAALAAEPPDLVLADYRLPDIDGITALERTRARCGDVPFVVVSGAISESFAIESLKRGATDYVLKQRLARLGPVTLRALGEVRARRELGETRRLALEVAHREQLRLGADLHDGVGQDLAAVTLLLEALREQARAEAPDCVPRIAEAERLLARAAGGLRGLARVLSPVDLWPGAIEPTLRELARDAQSLYGLACEVRVAGVELGTFDESAGVHVYRIAQEAITNAARHGRAKHAWLRLARTPRGFELEIRDDGTGFDVVRARGGEGLGLRLMEYRARAIDARFSIARGTPAGTVVRVVADRVALG